MFFAPAFFLWKIPKIALYANFLHCFLETEVRLKKSRIFLSFFLTLCVDRSLQLASSAKAKTSFDKSLFFPLSYNKPRCP